MGAIGFNADNALIVNGEQPNWGFKNYIINGNFDVWQRGTSFTGLTNGSYSADRWVVYDTTGDINYNVIRDVGTFTGGYGASYTWNSGTGRRDIIQFIENITKFKVGSSVTVSFEAYTNSTPYSITVSIQGIRGVWASVTAEVITSAISLTNTKTKYSVTLSVPNWSSIGIDWAHLEDTKLALKFNFGADTNGKDFIISNVQLEEGSVATPFENRPYGLELSLCQRYYRTKYIHRFSAVLYTPNGDTRMTPIPLGDMRAAPTVSPASFTHHSINLGASSSMVNAPMVTWNVYIVDYTMSFFQNGAYSGYSDDVVAVGAHCGTTFSFNAEL